MSNFLVSLTHIHGFFVFLKDPLKPITATTYCHAVTCACHITTGDFSLRDEQKLLKSVVECCFCKSIVPVTIPR